MATLTIRRFDDGAYVRLRERAKRNGRSLEAEAREILEGNARDMRAVVDEIIAFNAEMAERHGLMPDSTDLIRQMRDEG